MKAIFQIEDPDKIECTLQVTMTVEEWKQLNQQLINHWPSWQLSQAIADILSQAHRHYYATIEDKAEANGD